MILTTSGHDDRYPVEQLLLALFPENAAVEAESALFRARDWITVRTTITLDGRTSQASRRLSCDAETVRLRRQTLQQSAYQAALPLLDAPPAWGALAGVRPTKLSTRHLLGGGSPDSARKMLEETYYVTPARARLAAECSEATVMAMERIAPEDVSVYIGIPFCPTRCSYCSFVSRSIGKKTELLEPYLEALLKEIQCTGSLLAKSGRRVRTVYIGGGTPTTLNAAQLRRLMTAIPEAIDLTGCIEYTVEGGRPDTLDEEKLRIIHDCGAGRISINPQTMSDSVLKACGRPHTAQDILRTYQLALDVGFQAVNMDLIAGLPTDTPESFRDSLDQVIALSPANITVHTLALKKGADLFENRQDLADAGAVAEMMEYTSQMLSWRGYRPYYLYRQKYMSGSFENVGWSRDGLDCLYNIYMMEEIHPIISLGGGGMNKVNLPDGSLKRFHNPKFPEQYISQLDSVLAQKAELFSLLSVSPENE